MVSGLSLLKFMESKSFTVKAFNIVYLEDADADTWEPLPEKANAWNDVRIIVRDDGSVPLSCWATTEPGKFYTFNPLNPGGAFRIAFGQYREAWEIGMHRDQVALVQCGTISGYRDYNQDFRRTGDSIDTGDVFGVNQHTTSGSFGASPPEVDRWSAGCLVGRNSSTHYNSFIPLIKGSGVNRFDTTIVAGDEFSSWLAKNPI
jgi:hypothetical protein